VGALLLHSSALVIAKIQAARQEFVPCSAEWRAAAGGHRRDKGFSYDAMLRSPKTGRMGRSLGSGEAWPFPASNALKSQYRRPNRGTDWTYEFIILMKKSLRRRIMSQTTI
jgi:hypothetical protein